MKTKAFILLCLLGLYAQVSSAQTKPAKIIVDTEGSRHPWNHLNLNNAKETFQFAIVTDRTGGHRPGVFPVAIQKLNLLQPEFVMSVGDLIEGYTTDENRIDSEWDEFTGFIDKLQVPFFYLPGNHDYINEVMAKKWNERFGKDYYHFVYKDVLFLCLNSEERMRGSGKGYIDKPQYDYISQALKENQDVKWTLVFIHQPLWDQNDPGMWPEVEDLLKGRKHTVFAGHRHRYVKYNRNDSKYFILATTGGGSGLRGARFGEFDHVVWVTMTDDGPIIANLLLDGIWDENVSTEEKLAVSGPLMGKRPFSVSPILTTDPHFEEGKTSIRIRNDSDIPMHTRIQATSNDKIWAALPDFNKEIAPNSTAIVELELRSQELVEIEEISPISLTTTATFYPEGQAELELPFSYLLKPEILRDATPIKSAAKIDGQLKEWKSLSYEAGAFASVSADPFSHKGEADCSFQFDLAYDDKFLYLAAEVTDDQLNLDKGKRAIDQDGVGFMLDARPLDKSSNGGGRIFREITLIAVSPVNDGLVYRPDRIPEGTQWACKPSDKGYIAEVAIPISYLNQMYGSDWKNFRLNVIVNDIDMDGAHQSQISWQPSWSGEDERIGSGMFEKK